MFEGCECDCLHYVQFFIEKGGTCRIYLISFIHLNGTMYKKRGAKIF